MPRFDNLDYAFCYQLGGIDVIGWLGGYQNTPEHA
jgi:hypothetical protein